MHLNISAPQSISHLTELVQIQQRDAGKNTVHSEICQLVSILWIHLEIGLSCKGRGRWQRRGQGSNAISHFLLAHGCRDGRPFSSYSQQAQQCSFQISKVPINHFPQSSMANSFIFHDLKAEGIQFLWYIFTWYLSLLTQQYTPWQLTDKPYHCHRFISALRSRLGQLRDVPLDSWAPSSSAHTQYWPQVTSVSGERTDSFPLFCLNSYIC